MYMETSTVYCLKVFNRFPVVLLLFTKAIKQQGNAKALRRACQENCVNGYVRISRLEPVCQIVWQTDLPLKPNF